MDPLLKKLQFKDGAFWVSRCPPEMEPALAGWTEFGQRSDSPTPSLCLGFAVTLAEVEDFAQAVSAGAPGDALVWCAYPKASSKRIKCEFNRDTGWAAMGEVGFEPVRQVSLSEDWSALRFRRVEFIKKMTRGFAMTEEGRRKAGLPD